MSVNTLEQCQATKGYNINGGGTPQLDLDTINNNLSQAQTDISNLQDDMTDAQGNIGTLQSDVTKLKSVLYSSRKVITGLETVSPTDSSQSYISLRTIINHLVAQDNLDNNLPLYFIIEFEYTIHESYYFTGLLKQFDQSRDLLYYSALNGLIYSLSTQNQAVLALKNGTPNNTGYQYLEFDNTYFKNIIIRYTGYKKIS